MKALNSLLLAAALSLICIGCLSAPPTAFEQKFYDVKTNYESRVFTITNVVPVTNVVILPEAVTVTNRALSTNVVTLPEVFYRTNVILLTNEIPRYEYTPNSNAAAVVNTVRTTGNLFGPVGDLAGMIAGGLFGLWGILRSRKAGATAAALAQVIEVGRQILAQTPQGKPAADAWKMWMIQHQAEQGVLESVAQIVQANVNAPEAKDIAAQLLALMNEVKKG